MVTILETKKIEQKHLFNNTSVKALNDFYLETGYYFECEDGQVANVGQEMKGGETNGF